MPQNAIKLLPFEIIRAIGEFLTTFTTEPIGRPNDRSGRLKSWRNFCNCSQTFNEIKRLLCIYNLNQYYSFIYVTFLENEFVFRTDHSERWKIIDARNLLSPIFSMVSNTRTLIALRLQQNCTEFYKCIVDNVRFLQAYNGILGSVYSVDTGFSESIDEIAYFASARCLSLQSTPITDFSASINIKIISLQFSRNLVDCSTLSRCEEVDLSYARKLVDCYALKNARKVF
jgi:hypothetical protein